MCNLQKCKGACCIEGDSGAPLSDEEIVILEQEMKNIEPYLTEKSKKNLARHGFYVVDKKDGEKLTTCLPSGECNFAYRDETGILGCGIEKAWKEGKTGFRKPLSCHLYPIRIKKVGDYLGLNYHRWSICKPACQLGKELQVPVYRFLKEPLVRKFGQQWYDELEKIAESWPTSPK